MLHLLPFRVLVLVDEDSDTTGVIFQSNLRGYTGLIDNVTPENPEDPPEEPVVYDHIVFAKEGTVEVEIDGVTYLAMHLNSIVGYIV